MKPVVAATAAVLVSGLLAFAMGRLVAEPFWQWRMQTIQDSVVPPPRPELPSPIGLPG